MVLCLPFGAPFQKAKKRRWRCWLASQHISSEAQWKAKQFFAHFATQTQLHAGSSLIASCGFQTGKSSWAQTCFFFRMIAWSYLMQGSSALLGEVFCLHFGLLVLLHNPVFFIQKRMKWKKKKLVTCQLFKTNRSCSYVCLILCEWLGWGWH